MSAAVTNKDLQDLVEQVRSGEKRRDDAVQDAIAKIADDTNVKEVREAVKQIEKAHEDLQTNVKAQLEAVRRTAFDPNSGRYRGVLGDEQTARGFGLQALASVKGSDRAHEILVKDFGDVHRKAQASNPDASGGALVEPSYSDRVLRQVEEYGVFRRNAFPMPIPSGNSISYVKQVGEPIMYLVGESQPPTESTLTFARVNLTARKWGTIVFFPDELNEDAPELIGEMLARSIAWASSYWEDKVGFNGDGTPGNLRVTGLTQKLLGLSDTIGNIAGIHVGAGNAWDELTLDDHTETMALLPNYAIGSAKWFTSLAYFFRVMTRLMLSAGGVTAGEIEGRRRLLFQGFPVEITQAMPSVEANSQIPAAFGDLRQAADFGTRRTLQLKRSEHYKFAEGQVTVLATARQDIQVHSVGNASATAAEQQAGPMVALATAAA